MSSDGRSPHDGEPAVTYVVALLRESGPVPCDDIDWPAFHATLCERAELALARLRYPHVARASSARKSRPSLPPTLPIGWWEYTARWSRLTIIASAAVAAALIVVVRASPKEMTETIVATARPMTGASDRTRAAFDSAVIGRSTGWTIESALPSVSELLIPLGRGAPTP